MFLACEWFLCLGDKRAKRNFEHAADTISNQFDGGQNCKEPLNIGGACTEMWWGIGIWPHTSVAISFEVHPRTPATTLSWTDSQNPR